jgi:hypothetical protein
VATGGTLVVGPGTGPGVLTHHGTTTLSSGSNFQAALNGTTAGSGYSQLVIQAGGSIDLGNSNLHLSLNYTPTPGDKLFLVNNLNASGGSAGQFNGLAQGATVTFPNGTTAQISYNGDVGSNAFSVAGGNDIVLGNFVPVPEPVGLGLTAGVIGFVVWRRRRK